jgi:hypothetical protein
MGIAEHEFEIALGPKAVKWILYDVGGARGLVRLYSFCIQFLASSHMFIASYVDSIL